MILEILFILLKFVLVTKAHCVSDAPTTWTTASKTLTLATPDIHYNEQNLTINLDFELDNKTVWIGYFKALTAFEYFGCMREEMGRGLKSFELRYNAPGLCFSACGKQVLVGLRGRMCYCFENETFVNHHLPYCDTACEADVGFLCGGHEHVSLYKVNTEATVSRLINDKDNDDSKCLQIDNLEQLHAKRWQYCRKYFKTMCSFENGTVLMHSSYYTWKNATQKCYKLNGYATRYVNTTFNFKELPRGPSWTGVIRSNAIYSYDETDIENFSKIECGYTVLSQSDQKEVLFTDNCNSALRKGLCPYETSSTVTTSSTYVLTSELTGSDSSTKPDKTTLSANISSGNWSGTDTNEQEQKYKDSDVSAIIGASVASVLVVFAAVAVIVIILKRRQNNQSEHQTKMGNLSDQTNYITPISTEADDRIYINMRENNTRETNEGYEITNPQRNLYEFLHGRGNEDHFYETTNSSLK